MNVALLLPGFVRNYAHLAKVAEFLRLNDRYPIDVFTYTYDVVGLEVKETADRTIIPRTRSTDQALIADAIAPVAARYLDYGEVWRHIDRYFAERTWDIEPSSPKYWEDWSKKCGSPDDEISMLQRLFAQWHMAHGCWQLLEESGRHYDCVVRTRYDYDVSALELAPYLDRLRPRTLYGTRRALGTIALDRGGAFEADNDCVCFGDQTAMGLLYQLGGDAIYHAVLTDERFRSADFYAERAKSIRLSSEGSMSFWAHVCNDLAFEELTPEHAATLRVMRKHKHYPDYMADREYRERLTPELSSLDE